MLKLYLHIEIHKKMKIILSKFAVALAVLSSFYCFAWGLTGHRVVAEIAQHHLSSRAERKIKKLLGNEKLAYYANWPDFIKSDTTGIYKETSAWHYVNVNPQKNFQQFKDSLTAQTGPNLYTQIKALSDQIKDKKVPDAQKRTALIFLIHLVGDLHQPMHVGRAGDLGGNKINVTYFGQNSNLHSVWDSKLIDSQQYSYTEFADVLDRKTKAEDEQIQSGSLEEWLYDSHKIANSVYFHTPANSKLSYDYNYRFEPTVERQLLYGGLRLAKVLNDIFG